MKHLTILFCFILIGQISYGQTEIYVKVESDYYTITNNLKRFLASKESEKFEDVIVEFNKSLATYLEGGYGFSFEELNKIRVMKKYMTAFENFFGSMRYGSNKFPCSMKDIRITREIYPEITMDIVQQYEGNLILYRLQIENFYVYVIRHTEKNHIKTVYYSAKNKTTILSGNVGLAYKCVRKIVDNVDFSFSKVSIPTITKIEDNINSILEPLSVCTPE